MKTHSEYLAAAVERACVFPDPSQEIGPAGLDWLVNFLLNEGATTKVRMHCYLSIRRVLFDSQPGDLRKWFAQATVQQVVDALLLAACEVM